MLVVKLLEKTNSKVVALTVVFLAFGFKTLPHTLINLVTLIHHFIKSSDLRQVLSETAAILLLQLFERLF